jgi:hypothetical protein
MLRGYTVYPHRPLIFNVPTTWIYVDATNTGECKEGFAFQIFLSPVNTLDKFLKFWDDNREGQCAFVKFDLATADGAAYCSGIERVAETATGGPVTADLVLHATFNGNMQIWANLQARDRDETHVCDFATISFPYTQADLATIFTGVTDQAKKWGDGKSRDEFKDLITEAKYFEQSPLLQLEGALSERANSDTEKGRTLSGEVAC